MRCQQLSRFVWEPFVAIALFAAIVGCQSVNTELGMLFGDVPASQPPTAASSTKSDGPKFQLEIRESGKQPQLTQLPLPDVLYVQQLLEQSGAARRFRRMKIEIYRQLPGGGGHRLDVAYDRATHRVPPGADYAIHPNDRIVVTEDTSTIVDDMIESIGGPITKRFGG